jgi:hypothetical protein
MASFQSKVTKLHTLACLCMSTREFRSRSSDFHEYLYWDVLVTFVLHTISYYNRTPTTGTVHVTTGTVHVTTGTVHVNILAFLHTHITCKSPIICNANKTCTENKYFPQTYIFLLLGHTGRTCNKRCAMHIA